MSLIASLASSTCIKSGTNQLGSKSVCTRLYLLYRSKFGQSFLKKLVLVAQGPFKRESQ